ncbi:MAG TPA: outer membrane beta-barrel protein [Puia sp.]|jgi:hypothetical protein|nr:outer membrane beta-barrel protein [Puia sp.]
MKENSFYSDDFEQLIRGKTEQYKMYPSENVWKRVHSALHTKRRWFIGGMAFLVTSILFLAGRELIMPSNHLASHKPAAAGSTQADVSKTTAVTNTISAPLAAIRPASPVSSARHNAVGNGNSPEDLDPAAAAISITLSHPVLSQSDLSEWLSRVVRLPRQAPDLAVIAVKPTAAMDQGKEDEAAGHKEADNAGAEPATTATAARGTAGDQAHSGNDLSDDEARGMLENLDARGARDGRYARSGVRLDSYRSGGTEVTGKDRLPDSASAAGKASANAIARAEDAHRVNWLRDYAMNLLPETPKSGRTYLQLTLSPTVNYRTLGGSDPAATKFYQAAGPYAPSHLGGPNDYVDHSPALGFEFGGSILYRLTRNLSVKAGLQFNFSRYTIRAYTANPPQQATITLQSYYGYYMDSVTSIATANNFGGRSVEKLDNDYYQLSAPIGFELRVLGNERLQVNLGATIQPSYLLNTNSYMLTSGYTNYTKEPSLYRRWNISGGLEAFLSYRTGDIRWQIGPEFRYQFLSSYLAKYPITENLKGYGLKIGITKMLP